VALAAALRPLNCYLSLDVEDDYASDPEEVAEYVSRLPVDGINIEDSTAETLIAQRRMRRRSRPSRRIRQDCSSTPGSTRTGWVRTPPSPRPSTAPRWPYATFDVSGRDAVRRRAGVADGVREQPLVQVITRYLWFRLLDSGNITDQ
jgi:hypothetical protein